MVNKGIPVHQQIASWFRSQSQTLFGNYRRWYQTCFEVWLCYRICMLVEVGNKWVMFQMQHLQVLFEAAYYTEHFDTFFFLAKSVKKWRQRRQKKNTKNPPNFKWGGGGFWKWLICQLLELNTTFYINVGVDICVFEFKESIFNSFNWSWYLVFIKSAILCKI